MSRRSLVPVLVAAAIAVAAGLAWRAWGGGDERAIRTRLGDLAALVNTSTSDGLGTIAHAAEIGSYFTADALVEFGAGGTPVRGREALVGMAARLQPRTATFTVALDDIAVTVNGESADVTLTVVMTRRSVSTAEESMDAREFELVMSKADGEWRIARANAVEALKKSGVEMR